MCSLLDSTWKKQHVQALMAIARNIAKAALFSTNEPLIPSPVPQICQLASCLCTATPEVFPGVDLLLGIRKVLPASIGQRIPRLKPAEGTRWMHVRGSSGFK